ncbi:helix-turn-helix domain-containing protein [Streptomyces sviceus]|uniref:helix-turn-helix domain-containing protein n=1 Tax=Streptomyces sviceus TaxID=285530 RepID=UPI003696B16D
MVAAGALLTSARQGDLWRCACWARGAGCVSCCVRYADGGGLTAAGRRRREAVRGQAAVLFEQKIKPLEVAQRLRVSRKSVYQWHQLWRDGGIEALVSRGPSGSRCRLSPLPGEARRVSVQRPLFRAWRSVPSGAGLGPWGARPPARRHPGTFCAAAWGMEACNA